MSKPSSARANTAVRPAWVRVWGWPLTLGLLTGSGLVSALVSNSAGHVWSWLALGLTVVVMARFACFDTSSPSS